MRKHAGGKFEAVRDPLPLDLPRSQALTIPVKLTGHNVDRFLFWLFINYNWVMFRLVVAALVVSFEVRAHGGGLDKDGCHNNRKTGDYHCHRSPKTVQPNTLSGVPRVIDGDTIQIGKTRIRLHGIDAPEAKQECTVDNKEWRCGKEATSALKDAIGDKKVNCSRKDTDRYGRVVAVCRVGDLDLNALMVRQGWAMAYRQYSMDYVRDENLAERGERGMWRGDFVAPSEWRKKQKR